MMKTQTYLVALIMLSGVVTAAPIHTTYIWHLEQPIYWPAPSPYGNGYETAWESILQRNGGAPNPENDVAAIFSIADRVAAYQYRPRDAIAAMTGGESGAQVTYSGGLIRNVGSLGAVSQLGYTPGWNTAFQTARGWTNSAGKPRLEMMIIPYHHCLAPLVDREVLKKEIEIYQYAYGPTWGASPAQSLGFFPPEIAFSERIIPALVETGITWSFVSSSHISRACENFPLVLGSGGENTDPPNLADQINPPQSNWQTMTISRGCSPTDAVPFGFQPHYAEHVDPETGAAAQVIVVPVAMAMSWQDGYQSYSTGDINGIEAYNDPAHPMLITLGHDGDNAYGGGYSYYMESVPGFTADAVNDGYVPTTVPSCLQDHPPPPADIVHVEDGAWINADGDFGHPDFVNWNWPLYDVGGNADVENGWALDARNWAVITAATNRVLTAEQIAGGSNIAAIQDPRTTSPQPIDLAWHFLLGSLNSGYKYYGSSLDMEVKPSVACNEAVSHADPIISSGTDNTPPTIWTLQQLPHNPGSTGYGPTWGYQTVNHSRDFHVWTYIYDVSDVETVTLKYRLDNDGVNPLASHQNETFAGGGEVTTWRTRAMTFRDFPAGNVYNDPGIDFDIMPDYIADQYFYHVQDGEIAGSGGVLVDYYVEAIDFLGNVAKSDIYHTYVGTGEGSGPGEDRVWMVPDTATGGATARIYYDAAIGPLPPGTNPVYIHIGHSGWQGVLSPDPQMTYDAGETAWYYDYAVPVGATSVDVVFNDGLGNWDSNGGQDWHFPATGGGSGGEGFEMDGERDTSSVVAAFNAGLTLWVDWNGSELYVATENAQGSPNDRFIFVADQPGAMQAAPWAKSGQVANWSAYLAEESGNGWNGWSDASAVTASTAGSVLEGTINLIQEFGSDPAQVFVCLGAYATSDGGALAGQAPVAVVPNGDIEGSEWVELQLQPDSLTIHWTGSGVELNWSPAFAADGYLVYRGDTPDDPSPDVFQTTGNSFTDTASQGQAFYWVKAEN